MKFSAFFMMALVLSLPVTLAVSLQYDANGNLIDDGEFTYTYDTFDHLIEIKSNSVLFESYVYDETGQRLKKVEYTNGVATKTTYYVGDFVREVDNGITKDTVYVRVGEDTLARKEGSTTFYYHPDHLGSTTLITDQNGAVVEETTYYPFGATLSGGTTDFLYTGKEKDDSGLYYYGARYYSSERRQFIQADPIIQDIYDPQSLNRYAYVRNNPYKYIDPTGNTPFLVVYAVYLAAISAPVWGPALYQIAVAEFLESMQTLEQDPSGSSLFWAGLATVDVITPGIPEGRITKESLKLINKLPIDDVIVYGNKIKNTIKWTSHSNKHIPNQAMPWKKVVESTKTGKVKSFYLQGLKNSDIHALESTAWEKGISVSQSEKILKFDSTIGASRGIETPFMVVENSAGVIHGRPISQREILSKYGGATID